MTRELSDLLWRIVDEGNEQAFREFVARYPEHRADAEKRRRAAGSLRAARPAARPTSRTRTARVVPRARRSIPSAVLPILAVGALAFFGFATLRPSASVVPTTVATTSAAAAPKATFYDGSADVAEVREFAPKAMSRGAARSVILRNARLQDAILLVATQQGMRATIAPGFAQERIDVEIPSDGGDALSSLGARYGFTAFDQGDGTYLVVPARESGS